MGDIFHTLDSFIESMGFSNVLNDNPLKNICKLSLSHLNLDANKIHTFNLSLVLGIPSFPFLDLLLRPGSSANRKASVYEVSSDFGADKTSDTANKNENLGHFSL